MRAAALLAALLMLAAAALPACAESLAFGGRGEDALCEAVAADSGFFAVGTTASSDGDLDSRTRSGETGWALRVGGDGEAMWSFCSGKSGMYAMTAPHAYADGRFSLVLTDDERQRGEWIVLDARGRQEARAAIPDARALCPNGEEGSILAMQPTIGSAGPYLLLLLVHEGSGELCASALTPDGGVHACGAFYGDVQGVLLPGEAGGAVYAGAELGAVAVTRLAPGMQPETQLVALSGEDVGVSRVTDARMDGDGSLLLAVQTVTANQQSGARLLRISAQGETLFERSAQGGSFAMLTGTDTGYAALLDGSRILFFDEDGAQQGEAAAPDETLALLPTDGGVYALTHDPERGRRQALFTRIVPQEAASPALTQAATETPAPQETPQRDAGSLALGEGHLRCEGVFGGVLVTRVSGAGGDVWQTRIPIHTAADRLVFISAQILPDGDILLEGYYETDLPDGAQREAAQVRLSAEGVLREIGTTQ